MRFWIVVLILVAIIGAFATDEGEATSCEIKKGWFTGEYLQCKDSNGYVVEP